jgi:glucose/arabinose dehydrogenase
MLGLGGVSLPGCSGPAEGMNVAMPVSDSAIAIEVVADGLSNPVDVTAPAGDSRLFIVEQEGRIRIVENGALREAPFLDITDRVRSGGERGLLGLAFHPRFASNGHFYVNYTGEDGDTRVERYTVLTDPGLVDPRSAKSIIEIGQPFGNHNGGQIAFGPDGMLYIGMGDGGSANDPSENGQNASTLLGSLLRIDVDGGDPYAIPPDNPFLQESEARDEAWAIGLRNPWRFSFDFESGLLYIADVGQNAWEEVNVVPASAAGLNFGWSRWEGTHCFRWPACDDAEIRMPVVEYERDHGCSVIGGFVYRGTAMPGVVGHYFYSDWCEGWLRSFQFVSGAVMGHTEWAVGEIGNVLSFGQDAEQNLYVTSSNGRVYRLVLRSGN